MSLTLAVLSLAATPTPTPAPPGPQRPSRAAAISVSPMPSVAAASPSPVLSAPPTPTAEPVQPAAPAEAQEADQPPDATDESEVVDWHAFVPTDTADHLATMDRAARDSGCGVPWQLLAAIARLESNFGRNMATSSAGAVGYGQFLPASWQAFGNDGNVYDYRAALPAIAAYLCQSGLERDPRAALWAYNHADWYVDLVLALAARYDWLAPGAPVPAVLDTGPSTAPVAALHYARGRDPRNTQRPRIVDGVFWLGVPWQGRPTDGPPARSTVNAAAVEMLRAAFKLPAQSTQTVAEPGLADLADRAWSNGLVPVGHLETPGQPRAWSLDQVRAELSTHGPVLAVLAARLIPGHPATDEGDQVIVLTGLTPAGLVYNDPSFASNLGYGLEIAEQEFETAWAAATPAHTAMAFRKRPAVPGREHEVLINDPASLPLRPPLLPEWPASQARAD